MNWLAQAYEGEMHVVPDTEPGHVLSPSCWCGPVRRDPVEYPTKWTHNDEADRVLAAS